MHAAFLAYLLALGAILARGINIRPLKWGPALVAIFLLMWADWILTAQLLSLFSAIHFTAAYMVSSLVIAMFISVGLRLASLLTGWSFSQRFGTFSPPISTWM